MDEYLLLDGVSEQSKVDGKAADELATDDSDESDQEEARNEVKEGFFSNVFGTKPKVYLLLLFTVWGGGGSEIWRALEIEIDYHFCSLLSCFLLKMWRDATGD